jgi:hypothetical protein
MNMKEDIEDAFRITILLEIRLISALRHIESTLFDCVCFAYSGAKSSKPRESVSFVCHVYQTPDDKFRAVISRTEFPSPRISELATRWHNFKNFCDLHWPVCQPVESLDKALDMANNWVRRHYGNWGKVTLFEKKGKGPEPASVDNTDWPWTRYSLEDNWTTQQLQKLISEK